MKFSIDLLHIIEKIIDFITRIGTWFLGLILSVLGYFAEIRVSIHILFWAALFHVVLGIIKSHRIQKEPFRLKKFMEAVLICGVFIVFLMIVYANDKENGQNFISISSIATWIITGAYAWDGLIIASMIWPKIPLFKIVIKTFQKFFKEKTGVDLTEENSK